MTVADIYSTLVLIGGISPDYVLDKMEFYEINCLLKNIYLKDKESWERARFITYITAQCNSTKTLKPTDIMKFRWDDDYEPEEHHKTISNDDIARLNKMAKAMEDKFNNQTVTP